MCDFSDVHKYIEEKLGRPIWTHELADKSIWKEIKEKSKEDFLEICERDDPDQRWIPVSENMPEEYEYVLLCDGEDDEDYETGAYSRYAVGWIENGSFVCWDDRTHMNEIAAWMKIPGPYIGGEK